MLKFTAHASQAVLLCWPNGTNPLDQYERGEPMGKDLVWAITQRQPPKTQDQTRYVLSADRSGIFVISETECVITVLRMGETQRRILAGQVKPPDPPPVQPKPAPVRASPPVPVDYPADADLFLTFEFFMDARSSGRKMSKAQVEVGCSVCEARIYPGEWFMRVKTAASTHPRCVARVCMTCLISRKAAVWDESC